MPDATIPEIVAAQRRFFETGRTRDVNFRKDQLKRLREVIKDNEDRILMALAADMRKPKLEAYASEIAVTLNEIRFAGRKLSKWTSPERVRTDRPLLPSRCWIMREPLGVVLIIAPWNYPFQLAVDPLVAAVAAGNCAVVKPSETAPETGRVLDKIFRENFDPGFIAVVNGGSDIARKLLQEKYDHIFFTGSSRVGKVVMEAASHHLTPVTLELGGKSPCIVDADVHLEYAARRIVWAKFFNAGQTCIAPDYVLAEASIHDDLLNALRKQVRMFYGRNPFFSPDYARIINDSHFERLASYLGQGEVIVGGETKPDDRYIAPTVMDKVSINCPVMQEEIFGPILPVIRYRDFSDAIGFVNERPKPLALYVFTRDKEKQDRIIAETSSGALVINDAVIHFASRHLPYGGVGESGMGAYHGRAGFETFSHARSIVKNTLSFDIPLRYVPYRFKLWMVKAFF
jgi:acyl-CoA reductase-like NAD-dependent aldehyde dehydrogenase